MSGSDDVDIANPVSGLGVRWEAIERDGSGLNVEDLPSFHIVRLAAQFRRRATQQALDATGLSYAEWRVLGVLGKQASITTPEVVRVSLMDKAQISRAVEQLARKGLLLQTEDPTNARRRVLQSTPDGRALFLRALDRTRRVQARLLNKLSTEERIFLGNILERITQWLEHDQTLLTEEDPRA